MPNPTVPAAATGLPSRRTALTSIAAFGAALSLPRAAQATAIAGDHPDAGLIAHAAMVAEMAIRSNAALTRRVELEGEFDQLEPPRPRMEAVERPSLVEAIERAEDGEILAIRFRPGDQAARQAQERHEAAVQEWEAARTVIRERIGLDVADGLASDLYDALEDAVLDLTPMVPTTMAGLAAKARVAVLLDPFQDFALNDWEHALIGSVARDAATIGGAA